MESTIKINSPVLKLLGFVTTFTVKLRYESKPQSTAKQEHGCGFSSFLFSRYKVMFYGVKVLCRQEQLDVKYN